MLKSALANSAQGKLKDPQLRQRRPDIAEKLQLLVDAAPNLPLDLPVRGVPSGHAVPKPGRRFSPKPA
jgi:hypothetical protein